MNTPSIDVLKAIDSLSSTRDFKVFAEWIDAESHVAIDDLIGMTNPVLVHQQQGEARVLKDLSQLIKTANATLSRLG